MLRGFGFPQPAAGCKDPRIQIEHVGYSFRFGLFGAERSEWTTEV